MELLVHYSYRWTRYYALYYGRTKKYVNVGVINSSRLHGISHTVLGGMEDVFVGALCDSVDT